MRIRGELQHALGLELGARLESAIGLVRADGTRPVAAAPGERVIPVDIHGAGRVPIFAPHVVVLEDVQGTVGIHAGNDVDVDVVHPPPDLRIGVVAQSERGVASPHEGADLVAERGSKP